MNRKALSAGIGGTMLVLFTIFGTRRGRQLNKLGNDFLGWLNVTAEKAAQGSTSIKPELLDVLSDYDVTDLVHIDSLGWFRDVVHGAKHRRVLVDAYAESDGRTVTVPERDYLVHGKRGFARTSARNTSSTVKQTVAHALPGDNTDTAKHGPDDSVVAGG